MNKEDKIIIDLDDTITIDSSSKQYETKLPNLHIKRTLQSLAKRSLPVTIFSARNMRSLNGDLNAINKITKPIAEEWLKKNNIPYDKLQLGKPWAGPNGWYVDDKNLSLEEFIFKFSGPYSNYTFDIVVSCFNEEENIKDMYVKSKKLERLLDINSFIFIENGSNDNSREVLDKLKDSDDKVNIIYLQKNLGYGGGLKKGLENTSSDFVLINHADNQFDAYNFLVANLDEITNEADAIMPVRLNRPFLDSIFSSLLRFVISLIRLKRIQDFNGQPKIIRRSMLSNIALLPDDYCLDYSIFTIYEDSFLSLPVMQKERRLGSSSWKKNYIKWIKIFIRYIWFAFFFDKNKFLK